MFEIKGFKIKTPEYCSTKPSMIISRDAIMMFLCVTSQNEFVTVDVRKTSHENFMESAKSNPYIEYVAENDNYVHMIAGPKNHDTQLAMYYLKKQNIIIFSRSQKLAEDFSDLLSQYDFRIESGPFDPIQPA